MDAESIDSLVAKFVEDSRINNGNYNDLKPLFKEQLRQIEGCLQEMVFTREQIAVALKETKLSASKIASSAEITRAHIDNNKDILKRYIDLRIEEIESDDTSSLSNIKKKQEHYDEIKQWLKRTQKHLLENEVLESKITQLEQLNKSLQKELDDNYIKVNKLEVTIEKLNHKLRKFSEKSKGIVSLR